MAKHALAASASLPSSGQARPFGRLITKELDWPACIATLQGQQRSQVSCVAITPDGLNIVSGSSDAHIRWCQGGWRELELL